MNVELVIRHLRVKEPIGKTVADKKDHIDNYKSKTSNFVARRT